MPELEVIKIVKDPNTSERDYNLAAEFIIKKYEKMIHKHFWLLQKQLNNSTYVEAIKDDYYDEAYEALFKAIQKVDTDRVYDEKFKLLQLASWYIGNVRTKFIKQILKKNSKTKSIMTMSLDEDENSNNLDPDVEKAYNEKIGYKYDPVYSYEIKEGEENCILGLNNCLKVWDKEEKKIFKMLENGKTKVEIANSMKVKPSKIYSITNKMSKDLKKELDYNNLVYSFN